MMNVISRYKFVLIILLFVWGLGVIGIVYLMGWNTHETISTKQSASFSYLHHRNILPPPNNFKMAKLLRYCNNYFDITAGHEGQLKGNYTLKMVALVIRHGDRSPLRSARNQSSIKCGVKNSDAPPILYKYLRTVRSAHRPENLKGIFSLFPLHPAIQQCAQGQMTIIGALQHLQLGHELNLAYNKRWNLLPVNWSADGIRVYSTHYSRTFQSALAFLFGFLPSFELRKLKIHSSLNEYFCLQKQYCKCKVVDSLLKAVDKKQRSLLNSHPAVLRLLSYMNPIVKASPKHANVSTANAMLDILMGYVCHVSALPCIPNTPHCVTVDHVGNIITYGDWSGRQLSETAEYARKARLQIQGLLLDIYKATTNSVRKERTPRFLLYSGHDITLQPLLSALGIYDGIIPPFASRLAFELYSYGTHPSQKHAIRIVYNGKDLTKFVTFCKPSSGNLPVRLPGAVVCPLENFGNFVNEHFHKLTNTTSYNRACNN